MPATRAELAVYDLQHRRRQVGFGSTIAAYVLAQWFRLIDPFNIKGTARPWLELILKEVARLYAESALESIRYVEQIREIQVPDAPPIVFDKPVFPEIKVQKSLIVMGPKNLALSQLQLPKALPDPDPAVVDLQERLIHRRALEVNRKVADQVAASAVRHVRNGGRSAEDLAVDKDSVALGWVRVTAPDPCYFCSLLSSRGPVYAEQSFAESDARFSGSPGSGDYKVHDSCACTLRPVYTRDRDEWPEAAISAEELWRSATKGFSGSAAINAYRRAYENR